MFKIGLPLKSFYLLEKDPGMKREAMPDPIKAAENFEKACQADIGDACHRLANMYLKGFKDAVQVSISVLLIISFWHN